MADTADLGDDEREIELSSIAAIFPELTFQSGESYVASIDLPVEPAQPLPVSFPGLIDGAPPVDLPTPPTSDIASEGESTERVERPLSKSAQKSPDRQVDVPREIHSLSHLPPLRLRISLPQGYPAEKPPLYELSTNPPWLPREALRRLEEEGNALWEELGRDQVVFAYLDHLQQAAERNFDLIQHENDTLEVSQGTKIALLDFDINSKREKFAHESFECGVCLEPKKGSVCHRMSSCSHVFCVSCLQDFYNTCISEGDISQVRCLAPDCGKEDPGRGAANDQRNRRKKKAERTLSPSELLQIPLDKDMVKRYVELKRKKKLESDKTTVYCPRTWCQGAARSKKHPKPKNLSEALTYESDSDSDGENGRASKQTDNDDSSSNALPPPEERIAVCEDCAYAFCRVCLGGWHGEYARCWPRSQGELTEEEKASYDYLRQHTTPCPTCSSPAQKTHGCNHMRCFQCGTHFCYLCSAWLCESNPYQHFNQKGRGCYMRLWELEEGDEGNGAGGVAFAGARGLENEAALLDDLEDNPPLPPPAPAPPRAAEIPQIILQLEQGPPPAAPPPPPPQNNPPRAPAQAPARGQGNRPGGGGGANGRAGNAGGGAGGGGGGAPPRAPRERGPPGAGLRRFLELVENDEEDEWDSDELDDDGDFFDRRNGHDPWEIPLR
ncbi:RWD-domain-containing protein [Xylona heveae TC161]|uniref:RBR-type E3 ubiquitin transferase n=1 Tax=Xylona heveae (strain CBS 132557 / TC161) TaxID=1328760 RepID=A0A165FU06_XYLHT|nr:RWD-domain-containing protein [Xylona heveae TC161]KZF21378.1 RWD-domain-containing protein [Xylona heveae TC161]